MVFIQAALAAESGGLYIPSWALGLISVAFLIAIVPWASWVTYTIFSLRGSIDLSNNTDKTIFDKLQAMEVTIDLNHKETKAEMKEIHSLINKLMRREFKRFRGVDDDDDEKDE